MDPDKKISFGFSKISKKPTLLNKPQEKKVDLIDCLEGQNIKIKDAVEVIADELVIPLNENKKNLVDRIKEFRAKAKSNFGNIEQEDIRPDSELTIDELAARELLRDAKNRSTKGKSITHDLILPSLNNQEKLQLEIDIESTVEDYERIPIEDYGLAMLKGMGWKEGVGIGKNPSRTSPLAAPELRPKGLGLGATKILKVEFPKEAACDKDGKALILKTGSFAKIIAGTHKGQYCEVQGLDEESARVIVKTTLKGEVLTVNEFLLSLVTKEEYAKYSKLLNNAKYEAYKEKERNQENNPQVSSGNMDKTVNAKEVSSHSRARERNLPRRTDSDSDSSYESQNEKSSKAHKRKDKKRHKDRSRSPPSHRNKNGKKSSKSRHKSSSSDSDNKDWKREQRKHSKERKNRK